MLLFPRSAYLRGEARPGDCVLLSHHKNPFTGLNTGVPARTENSKKEEQRKVPLGAVTVSTEIADKAAFMKQGCSVWGESMHLWLVIQKLGAILYGSLRAPYVPATP